MVYRYFITINPTFKVETHQLSDPNVGQKASGDVSDSMDTLELTLATLKRKQLASVQRRRWGSVVKNC